MSRIRAAKKVSFRWSNSSHELHLLQLVESLNPFGFKNPKKIWFEIAAELTKKDSQVDVSDRNCKEHTVLMLNQFNKDELFSKRG